MPINRAHEFECCHCANVFTLEYAGGERVIRTEPSPVGLVVHYYGKVCAHCVVTLQDHAKRKRSRSRSRRKRKTVAKD